MLNFIFTFAIYIILLKLQRKIFILIDESTLKNYEKLLCDEILCL